MKIRHPFIIRTAARALALGMRVLFVTLKVEVRELSPNVSPYAPTGDARYLYCIWHDAIIGVLFSGRVRHLAGLASRHADGAYVAHAMEALNIRAIRGSSGRAGAAAIREIQTTATDVHIAVTTDGPRGPRREVKDGMIFLASRTGRPIVPVAFDATSAWRPVGKWTDLVIPKPFSKVIAAGGEPIYVPADLSRDDFAQWRDRVQLAMDELNKQVSAELGHAADGDDRATREHRPEKASRKAA